mmetsp:Transcript_79069/g.244023  ORF Transcript_79069/g.244023 Transcript_79069/m.244023 type:complete len:239 (-) Transcript_79069:18-734(-)
MSLRSVCFESRVSRMFTSTTFALFLTFAKSGNFAAGSTCPLVPTIKTTLDLMLCSRDLLRTGLSSASPKKMPSGLRIPPRHSGQIGTRPAGQPWASSSSVSGLGMHWRGRERWPPPLLPLELPSLLPPPPLLLLPPPLPPSPLPSPLPLRRRDRSLSAASCRLTALCRAVSWALSGQRMPQPGEEGDQRSPPPSASPKIRAMVVRLPQASFRHTAWTSLPCSSTTCRLPAAWWKPSTF